ncbi:hypothetical protein D3C73_1663670 [compost metagenome]
MTLTVGIDGIAQQIEQHLLEQHRIGIHRRQIVRQLLVDGHLAIARLPLAQTHGLPRRLSHVELL